MEPRSAAAILRTPARLRQGYGRLKDRNRRRRRRPAAACQQLRSFGVLGPSG